MERLKIVRGNDETFRVVVTAGGIPLNLTGVTLKCEVKEAPGGRKLFDAIIQEDDLVNGAFTVQFPSYETQRLIPNSVIYFDIMITFPDGTVRNVPSPPLSAIVVERVTD
jgi:hypothetical protein